MAVDAANGQIYAMTFVGRLANQQILSTFHYRIQNISGGTPSTKNVCDNLEAKLTVADGSGHSFAGAFLGVCPPQYNWYETWIQCVDPIRVRREIYTETAFDGAWPDDGHWANSAAVLTRRGDLAGRKYVGSLHVPLPSEVVAVNGVLPAPYTTALLLLAVQMQYTRDQTGPITYRMDPVLWNRGSNPNYTIITQTIVQQTVRTMRRRTVGVGV